MNDIIKLMKNHRSIRKFKDKSIEEDKFRAIIEAGQMAPTSSFIQAYTIIRVKDKYKKNKISHYAGEQTYIEEVPEFLIFCADLNRLKLACEMNDTEMKEGYTESFLLSTVDTSLIAQNILIAAESLGLGGVYIGGIRNNPGKISELLSIPDNTYPVFGMCLGYPDENSSSKPRLPMEIILKEDNYSMEGDSEKLEVYDEIVKEYYNKRTNGKTKKGWTEHISDKMGKELRPHMRLFLKEKGFEMK